MDLPVKISGDEDTEEQLRKARSIFDNIYYLFSQIDRKILQFASDRIVQQAPVIAIEADEVDTDITAHLAAYNHANIHAKNNDADLNATFEATLKDCDNHTNGSTNFVLVKQTAEADLNQTISDPPTQAEVQAISDKIDALLAKLRSANVLAT